MEMVADLLYDVPKNYGLVFDIVHYIVCLQAERADLGDNFEKVTRNNPLVSCKKFDIIDLVIIYRLALMSMYS